MSMMIYKILQTKITDYIILDILDTYLLKGSIFSSYLFSIKNLP